MLRRKHHWTKKSVFELVRRKTRSLLYSETARVFDNQKLSIRTKANVYCAWVCKTLLYGSEKWIWLSARDGNQHLSPTTPSPHSCKISLSWTPHKLKQTNICCSNIGVPLTLLHHTFRVGCQQKITNKEMIETDWSRHYVLYIHPAQVSLAWSCFDYGRRANASFSVV